MALTLSVQKHDLFTFFIFGPKRPCTALDPISTIEWSKSIQQFFKLTQMGNPLVQHLKMQNNNYLYKK